MEALAKHNFARISPQKARLVADQIRAAFRPVISVLSSSSFMLLMGLRHELRSRLSG